MARPNQYNLGGLTEIRLATTDTEGTIVVPTDARLSIRNPLGVITTVSGIDMTEEATYLSYSYLPTVSGWYLYEGWVIDAQGKEGADTSGFMVYDRVS